MRSIGRNEPAVCQFEWSCFELNFGVHLHHAPELRFEAAGRFDFERPARRQRIIQHELNAARRCPFPCAGDIRSELKGHRVRHDIVQLRGLADILVEDDGQPLGLIGVGVRQSLHNSHWPGFGITLLNKLVSNPQKTCRIQNQKADSQHSETSRNSLHEFFHELREG